MKVNAGKTKVVIFSKVKIRKIPKFKYGNTNIEIVDNYTNFGVTFDYDRPNKIYRTVNRPIQVNQTRTALVSVLNKSYNLSLLSDIQIKLFEQFVLPNLNGYWILGFQNT